MMSPQTLVIIVLIVVYLLIMADQSKSGRM